MYFYYAVIIYYILINCFELFYMFLDKQKAKAHKYRIPEMFLLGLALAGGSIGGFIGMRLFRHKTRKWYFHFVFWLSLIVHIVIVYFIFKA